MIFVHCAPQIKHLNSLKWKKTVAGCQLKPIKPFKPIF